MRKTRSSHKRLSRRPIFTSPRPILPKKNTSIPSRSRPVQRVSVIKHNNLVCIQFHPKVLVTIKELVMMTKEGRDHAIGMYGENIQYNKVLEATNMCLDDDLSQGRTDFLLRQQQNDKATNGTKKRVLNGFILFRSIHCKTLRKWLPDISNGEISTFLSQAWNAASKEIKDKYAADAIRLCNQNSSSNHFCSDNQIDNVIEYTLISEELQLPVCGYYDEFTNDDILRDIPMFAPSEYTQVPTYDPNDALNTGQLSMLQLVQLVNSSFDTINNSNICNFTAASDPDIFQNMVNYLSMDDGTKNVSNEVMNSVFAYQQSNQNSNSTTPNYFLDQVDSNDSIFNNSFHQ
ncbi:hypothetical protein BDA99DRAFT_591217 [Phascolomyces articulosus]|uniref:HMG box domain-containing protein n=1 Tax=Phascolomyces articulosus TaxID=60185 RepID=A0AAD5KRY9_9FUNG|nr:hypothetical protein BDA99DRAFT_591217 [Phascolomyces articulosus]